jgi:hypothetical protein
MSETGYERLRDDLPLDDQWIVGMVRETLSSLAATPAAPREPVGVVSAYQAVGGPQITERQAGRGGRWLEFEEATGECWGDHVGWYDQRRDRVWMDLNNCPGQAWRFRWHELGHSAAAPGRLGRTDFVRLQEGIERRSTAAELKNTREEMTAECGAVLLGRKTGTLTEEQLDSTEDALVGYAWTSPVALDPEGLERLLNASADDAILGADFVLEPSRQATAMADVEAGA